MEWIHFALGLSIGIALSLALCSFIIRHLAKGMIESLNQTNDVIENNSRILSAILKDRSESPILMNDNIPLKNPVQRAKRRQRDDLGSESEDIASTEITPEN